ncbi:MAG: efflux RND transporter periplasmic adaptor subunit [Bacteroidia bacterium]|nr:efflux RND transporter periplasmic adaptor subunit [Bacteroidia bacterium]
MNTKILTSLVLLLALFLQSCSGPSDEKTLAGKQKELDKKEAQRDNLEKEIAVLEKEIAKLDTSAKIELEKLVGITPVTTSAFSSQVEVMGKIDVDANAQISASMPGTVTRIFVKEGTYVKTGQTLAQIDNELVSRNITQAKQAVSFTTELYKKQKALWDQKIGSEVQFLNAKNNMDNAIASLNTVYQQNDMYKIKALYPGVVDEVSIKLGQTTSPGMPAFRIVGTKGLKLKAEVPESYINKVKQGNSVQVYMPDLDKEITGKVNYVSRVVDPLNRSFTVEINIPDGQTSIKTNMIGVLKIRDYKNDKAISIPVKTLLKNTEGYYVFITEEKDGKKYAKQVDIKTGAVSGENIEVLSGLKVSDELITTGYQSINDGNLLKITNK